MEILNFILHDTLLTSPPISTKFVVKWPGQNNGILHEDAVKFAKMFNKDVVLVEQQSYLHINSKHILYDSGHHMIYIHINDRNEVEKHDSARWQGTSNNCTLYAPLCAILRPLMKTPEELYDVLKLVSDKRGTKSAIKLAKISEHFFARDISKFAYTLDKRLAIKLYPAHYSDDYYSDQSDILIVFTHGLNPWGKQYCRDSFKHLIQLAVSNKVSCLLYHRSSTGDTEENAFETYDVASYYVELHQLIQQFKSVHNCQSVNFRYILVGHSFGGLISHIFNLMLSCACSEPQKGSSTTTCLRSISLDGSDFYQFLGHCVQQEWKLKQFDESKCQTTYTGVIYNNNPVPMENGCLYLPTYQLAYRYKDNVPETHYIVNYSANSDDESTSITEPTKWSPPKLVPTINSHYKHTYELYYTNEYYHSLHVHQNCSELIWNELIQPIIS